MRKIHGLRVPLLLGTLVAMRLSACQSSTGVTDESSAQENPGQVREGTPSPTSTSTAAGDDLPATRTPTPSPTSTPEVEAEAPEDERMLNPLTGLRVGDPTALCRPPLLVSISNFPPSARPQAGLSVAAQVWETYIGEGMTRFLAVYYGPYKARLRQILDNRLAEGGGRYVIGPVRSGRVVFEDIKTLLPRGILVTAGGAPQVLEQLTNRDSVYAADPDDINSAGLAADDLAADETCNVEPAMYAGLTFDGQAPAGGQPAESVRIVYNIFNQVGWKYADERRAYLRSQDRADGTGELVPALEALSGEQLAFENVLVLWAQHRFVTPTMIEMELVYVRDRYGLLFRDGRVYEVWWSTPGGRLRVHDENGEPVHLKPGATFFEVVSYQTTWNAEERIVRYHNPPVQP